MKNISNFKKYLWLYGFSIVFMGAINAQITNVGTVNVLANTKNALVFDYNNTASATIINNGNLSVYKNWENNGILKFTTGQTTSMVQFLGTSEQNITGIGNSNYHHILFNNTTAIQPGVLLTKEINIFGAVNFTRGIVQESNGGLTIFHNTATHTNVSNASFVDGKVRKIGNASFVFPIGDSNGSDYVYRMAAISAPDIDTDAFDAEYFWKNSNTIHDHDSKDREIKLINDVEYWSIERITGDANVDITLSWSPATTPSSFNAAAEINELIIIRWNGTKWVNEGGVATMATTTIKTTPTGYGVFTLAVLNTDNSDIDADGDGVTNAQEVLDGTDPNNNCEYIIANVVLPQNIAFLEGDCDNDGIINSDEGPTIGTESLDTDSDGTPDYLDPDDDGDGITTANEDVNGDGNPKNDDSDGDGIPDYLDQYDATADDDGDGISNENEDTNGDGDPTNDDSDGDGIPDFIDQYDATADDDGDGVSNADEDTNGDGDPTNDDSDEDGIPNFIDTSFTGEYPVTNAMTPNGDGINDLFVIKDLEILYPNFEMKIVDRIGSTVYRYKHNGNPKQTPIWWDGTFNRGGNNEVPGGTYYYMIYFNDPTMEDQTGWLYLKK